MASQDDMLRRLLAVGPVTTKQLIESTRLSQPTISRALATLGEAVVRIGASRSIQYTLRDEGRGLPNIAVYRVDGEGRVSLLGFLVPVRPEGFVMRAVDGSTLYSEGLPWWLLDMRPQGYLGRAYASRHGAALGLPARLVDWSDSHALRALLAQGDDPVGNLLLGDLARDRFLAQAVPTPLPSKGKGKAYARLADEAARGEAAGSSAGGEQPKFTAYADTDDGPRHLIVKFSEAMDSPISERWRDLLRVEHLALETLRAGGIAAARSWVVDHAGRRFLEVERFDRSGALGRHGLFSLTALDAEFVGSGANHWPSATQRLVAEKLVLPQAAADAALLWAFGTLIGNSDMHGGNLSFTTDQGRPYALAPAYDMTAMAFAPRASGGMADTLPAAVIQGTVDNETWRRAHGLAIDLLARLRVTDLSPRFGPCLSALESHLGTAGQKIARLG
ncbi:type II toxin-antitoxin system HipA family toxin YjjJ [Denitratisoma sp. agr-D3]